VINDYVANRRIEGAVVNINKLQSTHNLVILFEGSANRGVSDDHVHASNFYIPFRIEQNLVWEFMTLEIEPARHFDTSNYLFADAHVATIGESTLKDWVDFDIANGTNFAKPNETVVRPDF
jgi:prepilin-type processing-associated H-X9-DG protein